jgi:hypothetical protein
MAGISIILFYLSTKIKCCNKERLVKKIAKSNFSYDALPRTKEQEKALKEMIFCLALNNCFKIAGNASRLFDIKKIVWGMHPLKHLGYILSNSETRQKIKIIMQYSSYPLLTIKEQYFEVMIASLRNRDEQDLLMQYIPCFVDEVYKNENILTFEKKQIINTLEKLIKEELFKEFIEYIINIIE